MLSYIVIQTLLIVFKFVSEDLIAMIYQYGSEVKDKDIIDNLKRFTLTQEIFTANIDFFTACGILYMYYVLDKADLIEGTWANENFKNLTTDNDGKNQNLFILNR